MLDDLEGLCDGYRAEAEGVLRHDERLLLRGPRDLQVGLSFKRKFIVLPVNQTSFVVLLQQRQNRYRVRQQVIN